MRPFVLTCESTVDLPYAYMESRNIPVLCYSYAVDEITYTDDMGRYPESAARFYRFLAQGKMPVTSQLNEYDYTRFFEECLKKGDILHIAFGSGMTQSIKNAGLAAAELLEKYPGRKITVIDSLCSSSGYGLLVDYAADLRDNGHSMDEIANWVTAHRNRVHHRFFSHRLDFYRRSGRMSGPAAALASVLNICPLMRLNDAGKIIAFDKVYGKKRAVKATPRGKRQGVFRQMLYLPFRVPGGGPYDQSRRTGTLSSYRGENPDLRYRHHHRLTLRPGHGSGFLSRG